MKSPSAIYTAEYVEARMSLDVGGSEIYTYEEIAHMAFEVLGQPKQITHLPVSLFTPVSLGLKWLVITIRGCCGFLQMR